MNGRDSGALRATLDARLKAGLEMLAESARVDREHGRLQAAEDKEALIEAVRFRLLLAAESIVRLEMAMLDAAGGAGAGDAVVLQ